MLNKPFDLIAQDVTSAIQNLTIELIETKIAFCNRPFVTPCENGVDSFSFTHQVLISLETEELAMNFAALLLLEQNSLLDLNDSELKKIDSIRNKMPLYITYELFDANAFNITFKRDEALDRFNKTLEPLGSKRLGIFTEENLSVNNALAQNQNTAGYQLVGYVLSAINKHLENKVDSLTFNTLKKIEKINKDGIDSAMENFKTLINKTSF